MKKIATLLCMVCFLAGCQDLTSKTNPTPSTSPSEIKVDGSAPPTGSPEKTSSNSGEFQVFTVAPSEYPSWSTFMTAGKAGFINPAKGGTHGTVEKKWNIDIVLDVNDYDTCIQKYGNGAVDATCVTNGDILKLSFTRPSTAICPTSTSAGADKVIAIGIDDLDALQANATFGLEKSVSQYLFVRGLETSGKDSSKYQFKNLDPEAAATSLQSGSNDVKAICVWNPFALQTLRTKKEAKSLFDSKIIPEEIIDMVVVGNDALKKPGGENFAACLCAIFYEVNNKLADPATADAMLTTLGEDFSNLPLADMKLIVQETSFYSTPDDGIALFTSAKFQKNTMPTVVATYKKIGCLSAEENPKIGFDDETSQVNFTSKFMKLQSK